MINFLSSCLSSALSLLQGKGLLLAGAAACALLLGGGVQSCRLEAAQEKLQAEKEAHLATRRELAHTRGLWMIDQRAANGTILGLQRQITGALADFAAFKAEEAQRSGITRAAAPRSRTAEEKSQVVDDATRRRAVDFLNAW
ncbi:MAG: hypothetical protein LBJ82_00700 [Deltaproteobacteria bacterium]|jgi:hypothetical protein|nr:hypothetical protein [Deltaproteobacteria bacterium]